jgi:hypothetical protein
MPQHYPQVFDPGVTAALKRASPFWSRIRNTLTLPVAIGFLITASAFLIAATVEFMLLRRDVADYLEARKTNQAQVTDLDSRLNKLEGWQEGVTAKADEPLRLRGRHR